MKKLFLIFLLAVIVSCGKGHALAVIDSSNLAQNIISASEALQHTQNQVLQLQHQLNQYKRMLQDAMNPGSWAWGDIQNTLDQLKYTMGSVKNLANKAGGFDQLLSQFGSYDSYISGSGYGGGQSTASSNLLSGDHAGSVMQKSTADDLLRIIKEQEEQLEQYQGRFDTLKDNASSAEGQQEAMQAGNQFLSMVVQQLTQIHTLLMAQNNMMASVVQTDNNRQARNRMGSALQLGESGIFKKEREGSGASFGFTD